MHAKNVYAVCIFLYNATANIQPDNARVVLAEKESMPQESYHQMAEQADDGNSMVSSVVHATSNANVFI